jgi:hypothetical protein
MSQLTEFYTEKFYANPKSKNFVEQLEKASEVFKVELKNVNKKKFLTYAVLMYDLSSEARRNISQLNQRKFICAVAAGFQLGADNKFSPEVEDALCGANLDAARMCAEYCLLSQSADYVSYTWYIRVFMESISQSQQKSKKDDVALIGKLREEITKLESKIYGGDEVQEMRRSLYLSSKSVSLNLQMEDIIDRIAKGEDLEDFNPYPQNYKPGKLTYAGETAPEE